MPKNLIPVLATVIAIFSSCTKHQINLPDPPKTNKIKIEVIAGNNQNDTIGNYLKDSVVIKLTKENQPLKNYKVQLTGSGCDNDLMQELTTNNQGIVKYSWQLSAETGKQSLKIVAIDEAEKKADSSSAVANAIKPAHGGVNSACTMNLGYGFLAKLSTGRLICVNNKRTIYSDDNGISWHKTAENQFSSVSYLTTTPQDEFFLCADYKLYYSKDQGKSWEFRGASKENGTPRCAIFTKNNLLFACYTLGTPRDAVYISKDKGLHWDIAVNSPYAILQDIAEDKNGNLFFREQGGELYQSSADGQKWQEIRPNGRREVWGVAGDNNGNIYMSQRNEDGNRQQVLKSTDGGKTYHSIYQDSGIFAFMRTQSDGNIYTWNIAIGISKIDVATDMVSSVTPPNLRGSYSFVLANNNSLVFVTGRPKHDDQSTIMYTLP